MKRFARLALAVAAVGALTLPIPLTAAHTAVDGHATAPERPGPCDVLGKLHRTLAALGQDGYAWDLVALDGYAGQAAAVIAGARVVIYADCSDQRL